MAVTVLPQPDSPTMETVSPAATEHKRLEAIGGVVPSLLHPPPGCRFAARCKHAMASCREIEPSLEMISPGHKVACLRAEEIA